MVTGRLGKFYEEWCLLEQPYILDDSQKVGRWVGGWVGWVGGWVDGRMDGFLGWLG